MAQLVSLSFVKQALRVDHNDDDAVLTSYIDAAQDAVLRYLKSGADPEWTDQSAPKVVTASIVIGVQSLYDLDQEDLLAGLASSDPKNPIVGMLCMLRRPTLA